jgi:hypothetical protein
MRRFQADQPFNARHPALAGGIVLRFPGRHYQVLLPGDFPGFYFTMPVSVSAFFGHFR